MGGGKHAFDDGAHTHLSAESYLCAVSKAKVLEAVSEAVSPEAARKLDGLKKDALVAQAEQLLDGRRWLPSVLRVKG